VIRFRYGGRAKACVPELISLLKHKNVVVRRSAAEALGAIGPEAKRAAPDLLLALKDSRDVQLAAVQALAGIGDKSVVPALAKLRTDLPKDAQLYLDTALLELDPDTEAAKSAGERLVARCLDTLDQTDAHPLEQFGAYVQLAQMGPRAKSAVPFLAEMLSDTQGGLRLMVAGTLVTIQADHEAAVRIVTPSIPELVRSLRPSKNALSEGRVFAIHVLAALGPKAAEAIPALERASRDPDSDVQHAAVVALKKVKTAK
jgi:HEAT repeat protein